MDNFIKSNTVFINLIISAIIPFLIWGPFVPDLIVSISALFFLYFVIKNKNFYYFFNKPLIIVFLLVYLLQMTFYLVLKALYFILE
mgnify:CR=1 FL=1